MFHPNPKALRGPLRWALTFLLILAALAGLYAAWHYARSAGEADLAALERQAEDYLRAEDFRIQKTARRGDYLAALGQDRDGRWRLCAYDRDRLFQNRWRANGGISALSSGELASWNYGSPRGEAVLIFCGGDLSEEVRGYSFQNDGVTYICPVEGDAVLDIFVIPDGRDNINGHPVPLGLDGREIRK